MFYSIKNIKIVVGAIALFSLLFFNSNGVKMENVAQNRVSFSIQNHNSLLTTNFEHYINKNNLVKAPRTSRKYGLNETNPAFINFNKIVAIFNFTSSDFKPDYKKDLLESSFSHYLLRGPPIV